MDGQTAFRSQHGLKATGRMRHGVFVASKVDVSALHIDKLIAWLIAHPAELLRLWDVMEDEREVPERECGCAGMSNIRTGRINAVDTPINKG